jgi:tetratricopeptide (TPR) repeat protein
LSGGQYFVPLSSNEIVSVDIAAGKIAQLSKSRCEGLPGNLICHQGKLISEGAEGVDCYWMADAVQAEARRRLAANPNDAEALALQGEILLDAGKRSEAVASFRRAYQLQPQRRTHDLLRDALLGGLRAEFAVYRGRSEEIQRLLDNASDRAVFLRLMGDGLWRAGETGPALKCYQQLLNLEPKHQPLDQVDKTLLVRRDRWVQSRLAELRETASGDLAAKIDQLARRCDAGLWPTFFGMPDNSAPQSEQGGAAEQNVEWPLGKVEVTVARGGNRNTEAISALEIMGNPARACRDLSVKYDRGRCIIADDGQGQRRWQFPLAREDHMIAIRQPLHFVGRVACASGDLLLFPVGIKLMAVDAGGPGVARQALWTQNMADPSADPPDPDARRGEIVLPWQLQNRAGLVEDRLHFSLGPLSSHYVCFHWFGNLVAVGPRNGDVLWIHRDLPRGSVVFGDDRHVFVLPPQRDEAMLLRASNGELAGTRKMPPIADKRASDSCLAILGRKILLWQPQRGRRVLSLFDPLEGRQDWPERKFAAGARVRLVGEKAVGVMEPGGRFVLVSLPDGRTIADLKLDAQPPLDDFTLLESGGSYFLLTSDSAADGAIGRGHSPGHGGLQPRPVDNSRRLNPIVTPSMRVGSGRLYAVDGQGKLLWPAPVKIENQMLPFNQPTGLPVLTFACDVIGEAYRTPVLCIDKRSGRTVYQAKEAADPRGFFRVVGDAKTKTVDVMTSTKTVTLTFTNKPWPAGSETDAAATK